MCICLVQFLVLEYCSIILLSSKSFAAFIYFQRVLLPVSLIKCINSMHWWCWSNLEWLLLRYGIGLREIKVSGYLASINNCPSKRKTASVWANKKEDKLQKSFGQKLFWEIFQGKPIVQLCIAKDASLSLCLLFLWVFQYNFRKLEWKTNVNFWIKKCCSLLMKTLNVNL